MIAARFVVAMVLAQCSFPVFSRTAIVLLQAPREIITHAQIQAVCRSKGAPCASDTTEAYFADEDSGRRIFLIDSSKPSILALSKSASGDDRVESLLDFSGYRHSFGEPRDSEAGEPLTIYPALYPAGRDSFAVAVVSRRSETYAGGGAAFEVADFIRFLGSARGEASAEFDVVYRNVPFGCSQTIKACFSEKEFKTSRHCHEERTGILTIDYLLDKDGEPNWTFQWRQTEWPAHVGKQQRRTVLSRFQLKKAGGEPGPPGVPESAPFCGGPQS